ncbi:MAG TPA: hypothetical protein DCF63_07975 [Planctomycetaceae bacterium]|nr:hypothetical protein [Planctomycetaceae bacterium]
MQNQDLAFRKSCRAWRWCHLTSLHRSKVAFVPLLWASVLLIVPLVVTRTSIAQVVQLPAFRQFSYVGGSMLPDAGAMNFAGNRYSIQSQSSTGGLLPAVARSGIIGQTSIEISAQIIDLDALDQALLISNAPVTSSVGRSAQADTSQARSADQARDFLSNYSSQSPLPARAGDYGSIPQRMVDRSPVQPEEASLAAANIRYYLQMGREAEASQRLQAARVYYRLAQEAMTPEIHLRYHQVVDQRQQAAKSQNKAAADDRQKF